MLRYDCYTCFKFLIHVSFFFYSCATKKGSRCCFVFRTLQKTRFTGNLINVQSKETESTHKHPSDVRVVLESAQVMNNIFSGRMVGYSYSLPRKVLESPFLEAVKT